MKRIANHCVSRHMAAWAVQGAAERNAWIQRERRRASLRNNELSAEWDTLIAELTALEQERDARGQQAFL